MPPKVSIIVPNYNHERFLVQRLDSIFNQTYQDFEVILLDDCSTDNSIDILEKYSQNPKVSHFIVNRENSGSPFKQWKKGIELAKGEYIWIAESDDWADERFLEELVPIIDKNQHLALVYCNSIRIDENNIPTQKPWLNLENSKGRWYNDFENSGYEECKYFLIQTNTIPNASAVVFRKDQYLKIQGEEITFRLAGDWFLWVSLLLGSSLYYSAKKLNYWREHKKTVRNNTLAWTIQHEFARVKSRVLVEMLRNENNTHLPTFEEIFKFHEDYIRNLQKDSQALGSVYHSASFRTGNALISPLRYIKTLLSERSRNSLKKAINIYFSLHLPKAIHPKTPSQTITIACTIDDNYAVHCATMLASLFHNNPNHTFEIYIISNGLLEGNQNKLKNLVGQHSHSVYFHEIDESILKEAPITHHISLATYYRLLLAEILPSSLDKVLFLDSDLLVRQDIAELWNITLEDNYVAAALETISDEQTKILNLNKKSKYFNAGVLLINLKKWRLDNIHSELLSFLKNNINNIEFWDQDILNAVFQGRWTKISQRWNVRQQFFLKSDEYPIEMMSYFGLSKEEFILYRSEPYIVHFTGSNKPWKEYSDHPFKEEYLIYKQKTAWKVSLLSIWRYRTLR